MDGVKKGKSVFKASKLLKIRVEFDDSIRFVQISGDFFMHPEEKISELEEKLVGVKAGESDIKNAVDLFFADGSVQAFGFSSEDLAKAIMLACANAGSSGAV